MTFSAKFPFRTLKSLIRSKEYSQASNLIFDNVHEAVKELLAIDVILRRHVAELFDIRKNLWSEAMSLDGSIETCEAILQAAQAARNLEWLDKAAVKLTNLLLLYPHEKTAFRYCLIAEANWINSDTEGFSEALEIARTINPDEARVHANMIVRAVEDQEFTVATTHASKLDGLLDQSDTDVRSFVANSTSVWGADDSADPALEVIIFCHVTTKLDKNRHLSAPSVGLVELAATSFREKLNLADNTKITVYFDYKDDALNAAFFSNLTEWCAANRVGLKTNYGFGLRRQWIDAFDNTTSRYVAIVEQDHLFNDNAPDISRIIAVFESRRDINYVRLNRRANVRRRDDRMLISSPADQVAPMCRTARFSNTPHVLRTSYYHRVVLPIIRENESVDGQNAGAAGVEENVNKVTAKTEQAVGLPCLVTLEGYAIWGEIGAKAVAVHLGV